MGSMEIPSVAVMGAGCVAVLSMDMSSPEEDAKGDREAVAADFNRKMALALSLDSLTKEEEGRHQSMAEQWPLSDRIVE